MLARYQVYHNVYINNLGWLYFEKKVKQRLVTGNSAETMDFQKNSPPGSYVKFDILDHYGSSGDLT